MDEEVLELLNLTAFDVVLRRLGLRKDMSATILGKLLLRVGLLLLPHSC